MSSKNIISVFQDLSLYRICVIILRANSWELAGFGEQETPAQKYNRLKLEIEHLVEELSDFSVSILQYR